jgi:hypothetical protein
MPGNKVGVRLSHLERRLDDIEARAKRSRAHRPEVTVEYLAEVICHLRQSAAVNGTPFTQMLRDIGFSAQEIEEITRIYGPTVE